MSAVVIDRGTVRAITSLAMAPKPRLNFLATGSAPTKPPPRATSPSASLPPPTRCASGGRTTIRGRGLCSCTC